MSNLSLIIGNKNYSSWSLRAWLLLKGFAIDFDEINIELFCETAKPTLSKHSPTGKVPVLVHRLSQHTRQNNSRQATQYTSQQTTDKQNDESTINVWDTLAIANYVQEHLTSKDIWTGEIKASIDDMSVAQLTKQALSQSIVSEMHSGFFGVRGEMPMNIRATARITPSKACLKDLARVEDIFEQCLNRHDDCHGAGEGYLLGQFSVADAFYAPVVMRLQTYASASNIKLRPTTQTYIKTMLANPHLQDWIADALSETRRIDEDELGEVLAVKGVLA